MLLLIPWDPSFSAPAIRHQFCDNSGSSTCMCGVVSLSVQLVTTGDCHMNCKICQCLSGDVVSNQCVDQCPMGNATEQGMHWH